MIQKIKNGSNLSKNGRLTLKTHMKQKETPENTFKGQIPIFSPEKSISFFKGCDKLIEKYFQRKKSGCHPSNRWVLTPKIPPKHRKTQFSSSSQQIKLAESGYETLNVFL